MVVYLQIFITPHRLRAPRSIQIVQICQAFGLLLKTFSQVIKCTSSCPSGEIYSSVSSKYKFLHCSQGCLHALSTLQSLTITQPLWDQKPCTPAGQQANSTCGMASSLGISLEDICEAAYWATPHTFIKFYRLDVTAPTLAHTVLGVGSISE